MYCQNCGKKIPKGNKFCPYCGHPVDGRIHINSSTQRNLRPKWYSYPPDLKKHNYSPKHISKKAKLLLGCIFAVALIGGAYHIYHNSPAGINLQDTMNNKVYKVHNLSPTLGDDNSSDLLGGTPSGGDASSIFDVPPELISSNNSDVEMSFNNGEITPYNVAEDNEDSIDRADYSAKKNTLTISDGTIIGGEDDSDEAGKDDGQTGNYVTFKLHGVANGGKKLTFYPTRSSAKNVRNGYPHNIPNKIARKYKITLNEIRKVHN